MTRYLLPLLFVALQAAPPRYTAEYWAGPEGSNPIGQAIDAAGNVLGRVGTSADKPFYWRAGGVPVVPAHADAAGWAPRAMDANGRMYFGREGKVAVLDGGNFAVQGGTDGAFHYVISAAGDGLAAGFTADGGFAAMRWRNGKAAVLPQESSGARALALAINEHGVAAGTVRRVGELMCAGKSEAAQPGRAAYWEGTGGPILLEGPRDAKWHPQAVKAMNADGWMAGVTSPVEPADPEWLARRDAAEAVAQVNTYCEFDLTATRGFVARGGRARLLPVPVGDESIVLETVPVAMNRWRVIVGTQADTKGVRAVLWQRQSGGWTAHHLDKLVDDRSPAGCGMDLRHLEARAINDQGQVTGTAVCGDRWFAFRLTPVEKQSSGTGSSTKRLSNNP